MIANIFTYIKQALHLFFTRILWRNAFTITITILLAIYIFYHLYFYSLSAYYGYHMSKPLKYAANQLITEIKVWWETPELLGGGGRKPLDEVDFSIFYHNPKYFKQLMAEFPQCPDFPSDEALSKIGSFEFWDTIEIVDKDAVLPPISSDKELYKPNSTSVIELFILSNYGSFRFANSTDRYSTKYHPDPRVYRECVMIRAYLKGGTRMHSSMDEHELNISSKYGVLTMHRVPPHHIIIAGMNLSFRYNTVAFFETMIDLTDIGKDAKIKMKYEIWTDPWFQIFNEITLDASSKVYNENNYYSIEELKGLVNGE